MKSLFIIPTHLPHFNYIYELIKSFEEYDLNADLLFVFTNENEKSQFLNTKYQSVVLPEKYHHIDFYKGLIHLKKFYGLYESIKMGYKYAAVIDSESRFIKSINTFECMENFCNEKIVYATPVRNPNITRLTVSPFKFFNNEEKIKLSNITDNGINYFWFNNLPIYDLKVVDDFFNYISLDRYISISTDFDFDYTTYMYYALLYHDYKLTVLPHELCISGDDGCSIMEHIGFYNKRIDKNKEQKVIDFIKPYWICNGASTNHPNIFMTYHHDRNW